MKPLFQFLTIAIVLTHSCLGFAQKEAPAISKLDPAMDVNKKAAADLDWHNVTEWESKAVFCQIKSDCDGSIDCQVRQNL